MKLLFALLLSVTLSAKAQSIGGSHGKFSYTMQRTKDSCICYVVTANVNLQYYKKEIAKDSKEHLVVLWAIDNKMKIKFLHGDELRGFQGYLTDKF